MMATHSVANGAKEVDGEGPKDSTKSINCFDKVTNRDSRDVDSNNICACDAADVESSSRENSVLSMLCCDVDSSGVGPDEDPDLFKNSYSSEPLLHLKVNSPDDSDKFETSHHFDSALVLGSDQVDPTSTKVTPNTDVNNNSLPIESLNLLVWDSDDSDQCVEVPNILLSHGAYASSSSVTGSLKGSNSNADEFDSESSLGQKDTSLNAAKEEVDSKDSLRLTENASDYKETASDATRINLSQDMSGTEPSSRDDASRCTTTAFLNGIYTEENKHVPGTDWTEIFSVSCKTELSDETEWGNLSSREKEPIHDEEPDTGDPEERHKAESTHDGTAQGDLKGETSSLQNKPDKSILYRCPGTAKEKTFSCDECDRTFSKKCYLTRHHRVAHRGMGHLTCGLCDFSAKVESKFRKHCLIVHDNPKPFKCNFADCKFASNHYYRLVNHKKTHGDEKEFVCGSPECMFSCHKRHAMLVHQRLHIKRNQTDISTCPDGQIQDQKQNASEKNNSSKQSPRLSPSPHIVKNPLLLGSEAMYKCTKCEKICLTKSGLSNHVHKIHNGLRHLKCGFCGISAKSEKYLRKHCLDYHGNARPFVCDHPGCGYQARRYCALTTHKKLHMSKVQSQEEFYRWANGNSHLNVCSVKPKKSFEAVYKCEQCHSQYLRLEDLSRHVQKVHQDSSHLRCRFCGTSILTEKKLTQHCFEVHGIKHPFKCVLANCSYSTDKYYRLRNHMHQVHGDTKDFICEKCGKTFSTKRNLSSHKQACSHLREYLCDKCGKTFDRLRCLNTHIHAIHFGEKPHVCKHCGKLFDQKSNMKRHLLVHENAFPFACYICGIKFRHSNTLKGHMTKHGDIVYS